MKETGKASGVHPERRAVRPIVEGPEITRENHWAKWALVATLGAGLALRLHLAFTDDGIYWPDEIFQSLEPAHRLVYGYGLRAWEFVRGARNWSMPGLVALPLLLAKGLGLSTPEGYLALTRVMFCAIATATGFATYRLARSQGATPFAAVSGAALFLWVAPSIYFGHRAMSETASALPAALGLALAWDPDASRNRRASGASLLGLSVIFRLQNGIFCLGLCLFLLLKRRPRAALEAFLVLSAWAILFGLFDKLTWGTWYQSAIEYLRFNVVEGKSSLWGESGPDYYPRVLFRSMPGIALLGSALIALAAPRAVGLCLLSVAFIGAHTLIPHKELRFLFPLFPVLAALCALGLDEARRRAPPSWRSALCAGVGVAAGLSAAQMRSLTFGQLGHYEKSRPNLSALDDGGSTNRLLLAAHRLPDLCGLKIEAQHLAWTGGYSYLHRDVPLYAHFRTPRQTGYFNYALSVRGAPGTVVAHDGPLVLLKLSEGCAKDPSFDSLLP